MDRFEKRIRGDLAYMSYAPIIFISAKTGQRVDRLFGLINSVFEMNSLRITTRHPERCATRCRYARTAADRPRPPTESVLYHANRHSSAALCALLQRRGTVPFFL